MHQGYATATDGIVLADHKTDYEDLHSSMTDDFDAMLPLKNH